MVADHLSRLEKPEDQLEINERFPDEQLFSVTIQPKTPWYADIVNYLVSGNLPHSWEKTKRDKFLSDARHYYWDDPELFKTCPDQIMR